MEVESDRGRDNSTPVVQNHSTPRSALEREGAAGLCSSASPAQGGTDPASPVRSAKLRATDRRAVSPPGSRAEALQSPLHVLTAPNPLVKCRHKVKVQRRRRSSRVALGRSYVRC